MCAYRKKKTIKIYNWTQCQTHSKQLFTKKVWWYTVVTL